MESYLTMNISYFLKEGDFKITGNISKEGQSEVLGNILFGEFNREKDNRKADKREEYNIEIKWHPHMDRIEVSENTGNYGLRDGILLDIFKRL